MSYHPTHASRAPRMASLRHRGRPGEQDAPRRGTWRSPSRPNGQPVHANSRRSSPPPFGSPGSDEPRAFRTASRRLVPTAPCRFEYSPRTSRESYSAKPCVKTSDILARNSRQHPSALLPSRPHLRDVYAAKRYTLRFRMGPYGTDSPYEAFKMAEQYT